MNLNAVIPLLVFLTVILFIVAAYIYAEKRGTEQRVLDRLLNEEEDGKEKLGKAGSSFKEKMLSLFGRFSKYAYPKKEEDISLSRQKFLWAGWRGERVPYYFYGAKIFFALLLFGVVTLTNFFYVGHVKGNILILFSVMAAVIGFYLPSLWLKWKIYQRKEIMFKGFPDALDMMVVCVEAGMGLDATIQRVGEELKLTNPVLSEEFRLVTLELRAGKNRQEALRNLAKRVNLEDVESLVSLLIQTDKFGTSIAQSLRVYSDTMRDKRHQRAEEAAAKMPVKMVFPLALFIFPGLLMLGAGPAFIMLFKTLKGLH